jgi:CDP-diacylglycerol--glycerol-3-phosphate 3-phosphatidyltransferase
VALLGVGRASAWAVLIIIARELTIMGMRGSAAVGGVLVKSSELGRIKTALQFLAILLTILDVNARLGPLALDQWAIWLAVAVTVASAAHYLYRWSEASLRQDRDPS